MELVLLSGIMAFSWLMCFLQPSVEREQPGLIFPKTPRGFFICYEELLLLLTYYYYCARYARVTSPFAIKTALLLITQR